MHSVTSNAVANYANKVIKYKQVDIPTLTITNAGYTDIKSYFPSGMNNFLFAILYDYGITTSADALGVTGDGSFTYGTGNSTISRLNIRYYYTD